MKLHVSKRDRFEFRVTHVARFDGFDKLPLSHDADGGGDVLGPVEIVSRHQHRCLLLAEHFDQLGKLVRSLRVKARGWFIHQNRGRIFRQRNRNAHLLFAKKRGLQNWMTVISQETLTQRPDRDVSRLVEQDTEIGQTMHGGVRKNKKNQQAYLKGRHATQH